MRISDWSSDVCSSDLSAAGHLRGRHRRSAANVLGRIVGKRGQRRAVSINGRFAVGEEGFPHDTVGIGDPALLGLRVAAGGRAFFERSEEHTSELQSLMRISYAVFCLKKKRIITY